MHYFSVILILFCQSKLYYCVGDFYFIVQVTYILLHQWLLDCCVRPLLYYFFSQTSTFFLVALKLLCHYSYTILALTLILCCQLHLHYCASYSNGIVPLTYILLYQRLLYYCASHSYSIMSVAYIFYIFVPVTFILSWQSAYTILWLTLTLLLQSLLSYCASDTYTIFSITLILFSQSTWYDGVSHTYTIVPVAIILLCLSFLYYCAIQCYTIFLVIFILFCQSHL